MIAVWTALTRVPLWVWLLAALVASGLWWGEKRHGDGQASVQTAWDASVDLARAQAAARELEWRNAVYHLAYAAEQRRIEREAKTERTVADLRAGTLRLRDRFRCPVVPAGATAAGEPVPADAGGLLVSDAEFLVRLAGDADRAADERNQCIASYEALTKP